MFFLFSKILSFLIKPSFWIITTLFLAYLNKKNRKKLLAISIILFLFFGNDFLYKKIVKNWEIPQNSIAEIKKEYSGGIVLGGFSEYDYLTKRHDFKKEADRLIYAIHLYNIGKIKKIYLSGGNGNLLNYKHKESETIKEFLINHKINSSDIIIESKSRNTKENAIETAKIIEKDAEYLLITSATHMKRAIFCFDKVGVKTRPFTVDNTMTYSSKNIEHLFLPRARTFELWEELIHEIIGYYVYKISWNS